jgi:hypothetical protein
MKLVFGDFGLGLGNIHDLMPPILAGVQVGLRGEDRTTVLAGVGKDGNDPIDLFNGNQVSVGPFVAELPAGFALLGFHRTPWPRFGRGSIG